MALSLLSTLPGYAPVAGHAKTVTHASRASKVAMDLDTFNKLALNNNEKVTAVLDSCATGPPHPSFALPASQPALAAHLHTTTTPLTCTPPPLHLAATSMARAGATRRSAGM